jgi:hypothetical protein
MMQPIEATYTGSPIAESDRLRAAELDADLSVAGERFVAAVAALAPIAEKIARLDAQLRAVAGRTGCRRRGPSPAQLAADVVCGNLGALRPHIAFVTTAAADAAAVLLCQPHTIADQETTP